MMIRNAVLLLAMLSSPALAQSSQCTQTFCIDFPADWEARIRGSTLQIRGPGNTISVELQTVTQVAQFGQARREYEAELTSHATDLRWDNEGQPATQHGFI